MSFLFYLLDLPWSKWFLPVSDSHTSTSFLNTQQNVAVESCYNPLLLWRFLLYKSNHIYYAPGVTRQLCFFPCEINRTGCPEPRQASVLFEGLIANIRLHQICPFPAQETSKLFIEPDLVSSTKFPIIKLHLPSSQRDRKESVKDMMLKCFPQSLNQSISGALLHISITTNKS